MKTNNILKYITNSFIFLLCFNGALLAQNDSLSIVVVDSVKTTVQDSVKIKQKYGLRVGIDISKPIRTLFEDDYKGLEIVADYRLTKFWYIAGSIGTEDKTTTNDFYSATTTGSYFKAGIDYNAYRNWLDMENLIYGGLRIGASTFSQTVNNYLIYTENQYWEPQFSTSESYKQSGLSALWTELVVGLKVEVLNNLFLGVHAEFKMMLAQDEPNNFENIYVPGFYKTYDSGAFGFGYGYSISYLIPLYKKDK
ncbi:DUF6048 family protein [Formosa sp. S-31]|uniref:DUF6048 family protein n=1 Tax=Formosa sp. S-31 TaxID=2790949 RepID=UPI003EB7310F